MKQSQFNISLFHDTRSKKKNGCSPIKVRVYSHGEPKFYPTGIDVSSEDFKRATTEKPAGNVVYYTKSQGAVTIKAKEFKTILEGHKTAVSEKAGEIKSFSFQELNLLIGKPKGSTADAFFHFEVKINKLVKDERIKSAQSYTSAMKSLKEFLLYKNWDTESLPFSLISVDFLKEYERWMVSTEKPIQKNGQVVKKRGNIAKKKPGSRTTVGFYLRALRAIFNDARIEKHDYPFGKSPKYTIPTGRRAKKALPKEDIVKLKDYPVEDEYISKARDYFLFSYLENGLNMKDLVNLRYKDIDGDFLFFERKKTLNTTRDNPIVIHAPLHSLAKEIIERRGNKNNHPDNYVFPILTEGMNAIDRENAINNFIRFVNQHLKRLAKMAGIDTRVSTYYARHSYATISVHEGATLEFVKEALGHHSVETTKNYLGSFPSAAKQSLSNKLL